MACHLFLHQAITLTFADLLSIRPIQTPVKFE